MDSLKLSDRVIVPPIELPWSSQWPPQWPTDYRRFMFLSFAVSFLVSIANLLLAIYHPRSRSLLQLALVGPIFQVHMAAISGLACWSIWKGKTWARGWATATSLLFVLTFLRQFIVAVRPTWDHHVSVLLLGMLGLASFWSRDKLTSKPTHRDLDSWLDQKIHS